MATPGVEVHQEPDDRPLIDLDEARRRVLELVGPTSVRTVPIQQAAGAVLASDVRTRVDQPPFAHSAMDGYAVRSQDVAHVPVRLRVVAVAAAGHPAARTIRPGEAARILTGAAMVAGADCVVRVEHTDGGLESVEVQRAAPSGADVRPAGEGARRGDVVLASGTRLHAGHVGVAAAAGHAELDVIGAPRVAVVSTGDELVPCDTAALGPGQLFDSNGPTISRLVASSGCDVTTTHCGDDAPTLRSRLAELADEHDVVITTGGISMGGEYDTVRAALAGGDVQFWKVAIRPAKPLAVGRIDGALLFGLPGNPVAAVVAFELFVRPALRRMRGIEPAVTPIVRGVAGAPLHRPTGTATHFVRVRTDPDGRWVDTEGRGTHLLGGIADAQALAVLRPDGADLAPGDELELIPLWT